MKRKLMAVGIACIMISVMSQTIANASEAPSMGTLISLKMKGLSNYLVPSASMAPTIESGDRVVGDPKAYEDQEPQRGDIVLYDQDEMGSSKIARIVGMPGEKLSIQNNEVFIDDDSVSLDEPYVEMEWSYGDTVYIIPEGCYFLMGDNRDQSVDTRYQVMMETDPEEGYVKRESIKEKIIGKLSGNEVVLFDNE